MRANAFVIVAGIAPLLIGSVTFAETTPSQKEKGDQKACSVDSDCILFKGPCGELTAILKDEIKTKNLASFMYNKKKVYLNPSGPPPNCVDLTPPSWPPSPKAKCISGKCNVK